MNATEFWKWFGQCCDKLHSTTEEKAIGLIQSKLSKYDPRLGIELASDGLHREMIVTADGNTAAFASADQLVSQSPQFSNWRIISLKPAMGFDFEISGGGRPINAEDLRFVPLHSSSAQGSLGIRVVVPSNGEIDEGIEELIRTALLTGIGERAVSTLGHVEAVSKKTTTGETIPIQSLGQYIDWHRNRQ
jgi:hypothetical protein